MKKRYNLFMALFFGAFMGYSQTASLPINEDFENEVNGSTSCANTITINLASSSFSNVSNDNVDWSPDNGGTGSSLTGPGSTSTGGTDHNPGTSAGKYLYLESSSPCFNNSYVGNLESVYMNWSGYSQVRFSMWYHMLGSTMGTMHFDIRKGSGAWQLDFDTAWTDDIDLWQQKVIDITDPTYAGQDSIQVRIRGIIGTNFYSDMAIDDISIFPVVARDMAGVGLTSPSFPFCAGSALPISADFVNNGQDSITSFTAYRDINGSIDSVFSTNTVLSGDTVNILFPSNYTFASGVVYDIRIWTTRLNGLADQSPGDDTVSVLGARTGLPAGTYTLDSSMASSATNFNSFSDLENTLNNYGICGSITVNVAAGTYNESIMFGNISGTSASSTITIDGGDSSLTTLNGPGYSTIGFDGTSYITIRNLGIDNANASTIAVLFGSGTHHVTVENCEIEVSTSSTSSAIKAISTSASTTAASTGADVKYCTINNNSIIGGYYGPYLYGSTTVPCVGNNITNNIISMTYYYGIYCYYTDSTVVSGNHVDITGRGNVNADGMYFYYGSNFDISANQFYAIDYGAYIYGASTGTPTLNGRNNVVNNIFGSTTDYGLYVYSIDALNLYHNTILTSSTSSPAFQIGLSTTYPISSYDVRNNIFYATTTEAFETTTSVNDTVLTTFDYNAFYSGGSNVINMAGTQYANLAAYQLVYTQNANSVEGDPLFVSATDFHVLGSLVNDMGDNSVGVTTDIDGDARPYPGATVVDMGADEYAPANCFPPINMASTLPTLNGITIYWDANSPGNTFQYEIVLANAGQGGGILGLTATDSVAVTGLNPSTAYDYYVREICGPGDTSVWVGPIGFNTANGVPYFQNFETFASATSAGWYNQRSSAISWAAGTSTPSSGTGPVADHTIGSGGRFLFTETSGAVVTDRDSLFSAPIYVDTSLHLLSLNFWYHMYGATMGTLEVGVISNGSFTSLTSLSGQQQANQTDPWLESKTNFGGFAGQSVQIVFIGNGTSYQSDMAIDDVSLVVPPPSTDGGVSAILSPNSGCGLSANDTVEVSIRNYGTTVLTGFPVSYVVNGGTPVTETFTGSIASGNTSTFRFATTVNLSAPGAYTIDAYTGITADSDTTNDSSMKVVNSIPILSSFPYTEGFESGNGGWSSGGTNSSWALGTPSGSIINSAAGGTQSWVTNLSGLYNVSEGSYVQGPCFDMTSLTNPQIMLDIWWNSEFSWDGAVLQTSIDGGATWQNVGAFGDPNWYTDNAIDGLLNITTLQEGWTGRNSTSNGSGGWVTVMHELTGLGGNSGVLIRIAFGSDTSVQDEGFGFDNVLVQETPIPDVAVLEIVRPLSGCGLSATDSVEIVLNNTGQTTIFNFPVNYTVNNGTPVTENVMDTLYPGDTLNYTFMTSVNLSSPGAYMIWAYSSLAGDADSTNDSASTMVNSIPLIASYPYNEGFESGAGGWTTSGTSNNSWALGAPNAPIIDTAANGTQAWVTNLTGNYTTSEVSFVTGPCFDFTSLAAPKFRMNVWWNSEATWDGALLQTSIDGGATWQDVGALNDPNNWYTSLVAGLAPISTASAGWSGRNSTSNGSGGWVLAEHDLTGLGGQSSVLIRVAFGSDTSVEDEGFAFDDVVIEDAPANDVGVSAIVSPVSGCISATSDSVRVSVTNYGSAVATNVPVTYVYNGGTPVTGTIASIPVASSVTFTFPTIVTLPAPSASSNLDVYTALAGDANNANDSINGYNVTNTVRTVPNTENFNALTSGTSGPGMFANGWESTNVGNYPWVANSGSTSSTSTGPTADVSGTGIYMYTEGSSPAVAGAVATLTSTCYSIGTISGVLTLDYYYHMYGADIVSLTVEMDSAGTWVVVDSIIGQQQSTNADTFRLRSITLPNGFKALTTTKIRFVVVRGASFNSDVAIDEVSLSDQPNAIANVDAAEFNYSVNPNPSNGNFIVNLPNLKSSLQLEVRDMSGKVVFNEFVSANSARHNMNLQGLAKGIYFLKLSNSDYSKIEKLIIQ